jgi:dihydroneopterin aldolase
MYNHLEGLQACQKKIYLLKLFLYLGVFPENKKLYQSVMQDKQLHNHDNDALLQQGLRYCWDSDINYS